MAKQGARFKDPRAWVNGIVAHAVAQGVNVVRDEIRGVSCGAEGENKVHKVLLAASEQRDNDGVVVAH